MTQAATGAARRSRPLRFLTGYFLIFVSIPLVSFVGTQIIAARLNYSPLLGSYWGNHIYSPFSWAMWAIRYVGYNHDFWFHSGAIIVFATIGAILTIVLWLAITTRSAQPWHGLHGDARFITELEELRRIGLAEQVPTIWAKLLNPLLSAVIKQRPHRIYLGAVQAENGTTQYLRLEGNEHVGVIAPTRTGKGVGPVLINCWTWPGCLLTYDPKSENFYSTAPRRSEYGPVYRWNPTATKDCHQYNFLDQIRLQTIHEVGDAMDIATLLVDPSSVGNWDHWKHTGFSFLAGAILFVKYVRQAQGRKGSLADVAYALGDPDKPNSRLYQEMVGNSFGLPTVNGFTPNIRHPFITTAGQEMLNKDARERASVHSTACNALSLYKDPIIARNTARSDFRMEDLWNADRPGSLYITVSADQEIKLQPMLRMMLTLLTRNLQRAELQYKAGRAILPWKHRTLFLIDEFASLGTVNEIELALSRIAGYGVQFFLAIQGIPQLYKAYTQYQAVLEGLQAKAVYAPNDAMTAKWLSEACGKTTTIKKDIHISGSLFGLMAGNFNEKMEEVARPILTEQQATRLKPPTKDGDVITEAGNIILLRTGYNPVWAEQMLYFRDPYFLDLINRPMPPDIFRREPLAARDMAAPPPLIVDGPALPPQPPQGELEV